MKYCFLLALLSCLTAGCSRQPGVQSPKSEEASATCAARMRLVDGAKKAWADQNNKTTNDTPTLDDLMVYLRGRPACPSGGTLNMTPVDALTTCSIPEHTAYYQKAEAEKKTDSP